MEKYLGSDILLIVRSCISIISDAVVEYKKVATPTFAFRFNKFPKFDLLVLNMPGTRNVPLGDFQIENNIVPCNCSLIKVRLNKHSGNNLQLFWLRTLHQCLISRLEPRKGLMAAGEMRCFRSCFTPPPSVLTALAWSGNLKDMRWKNWNSLKMKTQDL